MDTEDTEKAVEERRIWLQGQLEAAAPRFGVELVGDIVNTYDMRSAGAMARDGANDVWMRVVVEDRDYQPACRWDGNVAANSIRDAPKPRVLRWSDWTNTDSYLAGRRLRGEVMTFAPGSTIAPGGVLHGDPGLPESWWSDLDTALDTLAAHPVDLDHELGAVQYTVNGRTRTSVSTCPRSCSPTWNGPPLFLRARSQATGLDCRTAVRPSGSARRRARDGCVATGVRSADPGGDIGMPFPVVALAPSSANVGNVESSTARSTNGCMRREEPQVVASVHIGSCARWEQKPS